MIVAVALGYTPLHISLRGRVHVLQHPLRCSEPIQGLKYSPIMALEVPNYTYIVEYTPETLFYLLRPLYTLDFREKKSLLAVVPKTPKSVTTMAQYL